jgi:hypothetical protein
MMGTVPDYGRAHKALRRALLARYVPGITPCVRCGQPITTLDTSRVHLDHSDLDPRVWLGLAHAACNTSAGASKGNRQGPPRGKYARRATRPRRSRIW